MTTKTVIAYEYLGGSRDVSFAEFVEDIIQDYDVAVEIATGMLTFGGEYLDNPSSPEYVCRYTVLDRDRDELKAQMAEAVKEFA